MPMYQLTNMFFWKGNRYRSGSVVDIPEAVAPPGAILVPDDTRPRAAPSPTAVIGDTPSLHTSSAPRATADARWRLVYTPPDGGDPVIIGRYGEKDRCESDRIDYGNNPDMLEKRLAEIAEGEGEA